LVSQIGLFDKPSKQLFWYNVRDKSSQWMTEAEQVEYSATINAIVTGSGTGSGTGASGASGGAGASGDAKDANDTISATVEESKRRDSHSSSSGEDQLAETPKPSSKRRSSFGG
jgi:hypothetical protein